LEHLPDKVVLDTINNEILRAYYQSQQTITELKKKDIQKNRWIAGLSVSIIILGILAII
jgi:hypothetical protein